MNFNHGIGPKKKTAIDRDPGEEKLVHRPNLSVEVKLLNYAFGVVRPLPHKKKEHYMNVVNSFCPKKKKWIFERIELFCLLPVPYRQPIIGYQIVLMIA